MTPQEIVKYLRDNCPAIEWTCIAEQPGDHTRIRGRFYFGGEFANHSVICYTVIDPELTYVHSVPQLMVNLASGIVAAMLDWRE